MSTKDEVERLFRESINNHPDQDFIESMGKIEINYTVDKDGVKLVRGNIENCELMFGFPIDTKGYLAENELGKIKREELALEGIKSLKRVIDRKNRPKVSTLLKETIKAISDQHLIKTYGMYNDHGTETFKAKIPNHEKGLFFAGGIYPNFWGKKMNTIKFVKSQEYRKLFVNDVILAIMEHCEENGVC